MPFCKEDLYGNTKKNDKINPVEAIRLMADSIRFRNKYRIKSTRKPGWNYAEYGYYFVTLCVQNRECAFGKIDNGKIVLSPIGKIVWQYWLEIPTHFPFVKPDNNQQ